MSKRANGEGSIHQRKDGLWQGQISVAASGLVKAKRLSVYGHTQAEALAKLRALREGLDAGEQPRGRPKTVSGLGTYYLNTHLRAEVDRGQNAESTLANYRNLWARHVEPDLGHVRLNDLTPALVRQWLARKATTPSAHTQAILSPATQRRIHAVLRAALGVAVRDGIISDNPLTRVAAPRGGSRKIVPLTEAELTALLKAVAGHRVLDALATLMCLTGARPGEALAASWSDIDLEAGQWRITRTLTFHPLPGRAGSKRTLGVTGRTKTDASADMVMLPQVLVLALSRHRVRQTEEHLAAASWRDSDLVFTSTVGSLLDPRNVRREFQTLAQGAGITRPVRLHDLRHAAASALLNEGVDMALASKLLRHSRMATTVDVYGHLLDQGRTRAAEVMERHYHRLMS